MLRSWGSSAYFSMQMAFKANPIIPALLTKCLFFVFSALFSIPSQVNWIHYELESKLKNYCFGFMETLWFGIKI